MNLPIKVNIDYESELFTGKKLPFINEALEFLAFYLEERPILTSKCYSEIYLNHIETLTGHRPVLQTSGSAQNWWGALNDLPKERWLNSKITSARLNQARGWRKDIVVVEDRDAINKILPSRAAILKDPFGMSGQKFQVIHEQEDFSLLGKWIDSSLKQGPLIYENLLLRQKDFSSYIFSDGQSICYENFVDEKFQYRGTLIKGEATFDTLSFINQLSDHEIARHLERTGEIISCYQNPQIGNGFSIDSFTYQEDEILINSLSEVNYRRTMGSICYQLARKLTPGCEWSMLLLTKPFPRAKLQSLSPDRQANSGVLVLSPGDTRYEVLFIFAGSDHEGTRLLRRVKELLPETQLPIEV
jgi:hypothetical protein